MRTICRCSRYDFPRVNRVGLLSSSTLSLSGCVRLCSSDNGSSAASLLDAAEREQAALEAAVDCRQVLFAAGASADHRPRVAAAEAFDTARAALPRPPNFCAMHISLDYSAMLDAPQVLWQQLCQANDVALNRAPRDGASSGPWLVGGAVNHQRLGGGGFIQVLLGCIPDLSMDVFTFDGIPTQEELHGTAADVRVPPFACFTGMDAKLLLHHEAELQARVAMLGRNVGPSCVLCGAVYPPVGNAGLSDKKKTLASNSELDESIFFFNDRVYRGSAAGAVLRSKLVRAHQLSVVPSIGLRTGVAVSGTLTSDCGSGRVVSVAALNGISAVEYIKQIYTEETIKDTAKVFVGLSHKEQPNTVMPVTFYANPAEGPSIHFLLPSGFPDVTDGALVSFLVDDAELDAESAASGLIALQRKLEKQGMVSVAKDITIAREGRKSVVTSSCGGVFFANRLMNVTSHRDDVIGLGMGATAQGTMTVPSVLQRVMGRTIANSGAYTPGQIVNVGGTVSVSARCSTYTIFEGLA